MSAPDINKLLRANPRHSQCGAPMGARNVVEDDGARLYCQRVRFVDGDYGPDGTYWGGGRGTLPLYCVFSADLGTCWYGRADNLQSALDAFYDEHPDAVRGRLAYVNRRPVSP